MSQGSTPPKPAVLALADGTVYRGQAFGAETVGVGEVCFNTSLTGYQEILTDPSYRGQTVLLTQPHIGNYGVNSEDEESTRLWLSGLIVREACQRASNFRSGGELSDYLIQHDIHHRGQVHAMLSDAGVDPPQLDDFYLDFGRVPSAQIFWE